MKVTNGLICRKNISNNLPAAVEVKSADKKLDKVDKKCQQKLFIFPKKVNLQPFKNNVLAAVEVKSADKTEAVEGPKIWGSPGLPCFRRPCKNDTKVFKCNRSQKMS